MKTHFTDALQVVAALLLTGGMVAYAAPLTTATLSIPKSANKIVVQHKPVSPPLVAAVAAPAAVPAVTWQDNPNHCTDAQWIAAGAPFGCIDKPVAAPVQNIAPVASTAVVAGCGDNFYANYIYMHESGCNTGSRNYLNCYGIGQNCPALIGGTSTVEIQCGGDYSCQNSYFIDYANSRYGGWANAYDFWLTHSWW